MQRISALFKNNLELQTLSHQAGSVSVSQKIWASTVPETLRPFTQAGNVKHKRLTVYADNGSVAAKIKLLLPSLLSQLQKQGLEVTSIRVEVQVKSSRKPPAKTMRSISRQASSSLGALAEELNGSALGEVLHRLSRRT